MSPPAGDPTRTVTILIVDDELPIADIVAEVLGEEGYTTVIASGGEHALEILATSSADLMLLDLYMPGMSGIDVLERLRSRNVLGSMPVVVMTAGTVKLDDLSVHGATGVLPKPFEVETLIQTVRAFV
jgi:CheY-like chemotaxis protein